MAKMLSTKAPQSVPVEFERIFIEHGWDRANYLFGKRPTTRYYMLLGPERLRAARDEHLRAIKALKENMNTASAGKTRIHRRR